MKRGRKRLDGLDAMLPGKRFVKDQIRSLHSASPKAVRVFSDRNVEMAWRYRTGATLEQIGAVFCVTRERVRQILRGMGIDRSQGGAHVLTIARVKQRAERRTRRDQQHDAKWGYTRAEIAAMSPLSRMDERHPVRRYTSMRENSRSRGILFTLTFRQWWETWTASGHLDEIGPGRYVMARIRADGPYSIDNVEVCTNAVASSRAYLYKPAADRVRKCLATKAAKLQRIAA